MNTHNDENIIDIDKSYTSPDDQFLFAFDNAHVKTASQLKEIKKHRKIATLRDGTADASSDKEVWKGF